MSRSINGGDPRQYGLDFGLWTRSLVARSDRAEVRHSAGRYGGGELLAKLGLTPQKPRSGPISAIRQRLRRGSANGILPCRTGKSLRW